MSRVVVVPQPPLLVPRLTVRASPEVAELRDACRRAVALLAEVSGEWLALGTDSEITGELPPTTRGTFAGFGVDVPVSFGPAAASCPEETLPLPALVGGWLREQAGANGMRMWLLDEAGTAERAREVGSELAEAADTDRTALLVLADGPREFGAYGREGDPARATALLRAGLSGPDPHSLEQLGEPVATRSGVRGGAALRALAGLLASDGGRWEAELLYSAAPFGVGYHVAVWSRSGR
ncbi:hypothetical protein [Actinopolyspora mortivallis]|uniref:hypothetical protein n=1 Tax=Actinopolyspora mortivallis TaxID=33906 RepID=UPI00036F7E6C|nr:hypothetical protein [Actinopolyspora mortivallis]